jgi:hypothetical protein
MATILMNQTDRESLIAESRAACIRLLKKIGGANAESPPEHHCLLWSGCLCKSLRERGVMALLQAGTCQWPRLRPDQDDGREETCSHFSHMFDRTAAMPILMEGRLPEIHCWLAVPAASDQDCVLIDPTTGGWPEKCRLTTGMDWPGDPPPAFLWCKAKDIPPRVVYRGDRLATSWAVAFLHSALTGEPLHLRM